MCWVFSLSYRIYIGCWPVKFKHESRELKYNMYLVPTVSCVFVCHCQYLDQQSKEWPKLIILSKGALTGRYVKCCVDNTFWVRNQWWNPLEATCRVLNIDCLSSMIWRGCNSFLVPVHMDCAITDCYLLFSVKLSQFWPKDHSQQRYIQCHVNQRDS